MTDATDNVSPPTITGSAAVDFLENGTGAVATYTVNDPENAATSWLPLEGADRRRFEISSDGALSFLESPDHERPADSGGDNVYDVTITVSDGKFSASLEVAVTVTAVDEPPVIRGLNDIETAENFAPFSAGWAATDPEGATDTFTWSLSGTDADDFNIDGGTGRVTFKSVPNYEAATDSNGDNEYLVTVQADDGTSSDLGTFDVTITVTGVDEPPVINGPKSFNVEENSTPTLATYSATDPEGDQVGELELTMPDLFRFELSASGELSIKEELDYEMPTDANEDGVYVVTIRALAGTLRGTLDVTVTITNVNEAPIIRGHDQITHQERSTSGCLHRYQVSDPEFDDTSWLSPSGTDGAAFRINDSGDLCFITEADFENPHDSDLNNVYLLTITASDGSLTDTLDVTVTVTGVDEPPDISGEFNIEVPEGSTGTIETYSAVDPEGETVTWEELTGDDADLFNFDSSSGALSFKAAPDFEDPEDDGRNNGYLVNINATDGDKTGTHYLTITVTDENEAPTISGNDALSYPEHTATTAVLGRYTASDPEGGEVTWSVGGTDADAFRIDASGNLSFDTTPDHETATDSGGDNVYDIQVVATDSGNLNDGTLSPGGATSSTFDVTVTVTPVDEPPDISGTTTINNYPENGTGNVATYTATDPEGDPNITWSLAGPDRGDFDITGGGLTFKEVPDYESPADSGGNNQYEVSVQATDSNNKRGELHVDVIVTPVDEPPEVMGSDTVNDFPENSPTSRQVGRYTASDPEGATVTLSLTGNDSNDFTLSPNGILTFKELPDYEEKSNYSVTVRAVAGSHTVDRVVTVNIQNLEERGTVTLSVVQPQAETPLTATLEDDDGPSGITWQWYRTSSQGSTGTAITSATSATHTPGADDVGSYLRAVASYDDGFDTGNTAATVSANRVQVIAPGNEAPVFPADGDYGRSIRENQQAGSNVGTPVTATDANNDRLTYSIGDSDEFEINQSTGQLRTKVQLDREKQAQHVVTVAAIDPSGLDDETDVTITIEDVDETPEISGPTNPEVEENGDTDVATYKSTDPDGKGIEWVLMGTDSDAFTLNGTGALTFNTVPDFEEKNQYRVTIEAREQGDGNSVGRLNVTIRVTNVDEPGAVEVPVSEPRVGQQLMATVVDSDGGVASIEWKWERRTSGGGTWTPIVGATSRSYTPTRDDNGHDLRIEVIYHDRQGPGKFATHQFASPVVLRPFFPSDTDTRSLQENTAEGRNVGERFTARHPDNVNLTYRLGGADTGFFTIDNSGQLKTSATPLDYETQLNGEAVVEITAEDNNGQTTTIAVTVTVTDECTSTGEPPCAPGRPRGIVGVRHQPPSNLVRSQDSLRYFHHRLPTAIQGVGWRRKLDSPDRGGNGPLPQY